MVFSFRYMIATLCLLLSSSTIFAQSENDYSELQERVAELKNTIPNQEQDNSFKVEQEEFERMRQQLIEAENRIVNKTSDHTSRNEMETFDEAVVASDEMQNASNIENSLEASQQTVDVPPQESAHKGHQISDSKVNPIEHNARITALEQELQDARNKLLVAEAEIDRLNNLLSNQKSVQPVAKSDSALVFSTASGSKEAAEEETYDLVITVVADKTSLRGSPDKTSVRIMELSKGARLKVEDRQGDWFRITTKSGTRAWVSAKDVAFGPTESTSPTNTVRIRPIAIEQSDEEARAFDLIKNHSHTK